MGKLLSFPDSPVSPQNPTDEALEEFGFEPESIGQPEELQGCLTVDSVVKSFKKRPIVRGVSLSLNRGEAVGLLGPNGAGKTTVFYMITGLIPVDEGRILIDGEDITRLPMYRRARLGIGYLPQEFNIARVRKSPSIALSGGERRRVEIARALASKPTFMLLDEPFAGIDPIAIGDIRELVRQLTDRGIGVLITDHNVRETLDLVDRAYIIHEGQLLIEGTPEEIIANEDVRRVYLGDDFSL